MLSASGRTFSGARSPRRASKSRDGCEERETEGARAGPCGVLGGGGEGKAAAQRCAMDSGPDSPGRSDDEVPSTSAAAASAQEPGVEEVRGDRSWGRVARAGLRHPRSARGTNGRSPPFPRCHRCAPRAGGAPGAARAAPGGGQAGALDLLCRGLPARGVLGRPRLVSEQPRGRLSPRVPA